MANTGSRASARPAEGNRGGRNVGRNWLVLITGVLATAILATSGIGWAWVRHLDGKIERVDPFKDLANRPDTGSGKDLNFLIVGSDNREGIPKATLDKLHAGGESCDCTDTIMIVHLNGKRDRATITSLPRDSYVTFPAHKDKRTGQQRGETKGKINAAYTLGGPALTVDTVEKSTGIRIDHYVEVNFVSFVSVVDALGGVEMCTPKPLHDPKSGLDLPAGTSRLDGQKSLQFVRARYIASDPTGDIGRTQRQQKFITQVLAKATDSGTLTDPLKLKNVVDAVLGSIKVDEKLKPQDFLALGKEMKNLSNSGVTYAQVPLKSIDHQVPEWGSTVLWDDVKARGLFDAIRGDKDLIEPAKSETPKNDGPGGNATGAPTPTQVEVAPGDIAVQVYNGTPTQGLGTRANDDLKAVGFAMAGPPRNSTPPDGVHTTIRYDPKWNRSVKTVQAALPNAVSESVTGLGRTIEVVVGSSYTGVAPVQVGKPTPTATEQSADPAAPPYSAKSGDEVSCKK
ncbi:LCP family protein [Streptomyces sp. SID3343]|uniref:LCP family protein n=1 Tax=Streptomyces sp. SID3343 TaxID=2690260 RepID=UPI00136D22E2|nr:LCP family protein [Streptomyces sp. SID3343]MYW03667.1 LytR family transcriptional regulator [Streptomyces sp. SID3343]